MTVTYGQSEIDNLRRQIDLLEPVFEISTRRVNGEDFDWEVERQGLESELFGMLAQDRPNMSESSAAYILGKCQVIARRLSAPKKIIQEYEDMQRRLTEMIQGQARYKESLRSAQEADAAQTWR